MDRKVDEVFPTDFDVHSINRKFELTKVSISARKRAQV